MLSVLSVLYFILSLITNLIVYAFVLFALIVLWIKLWLEPFKGVCSCKARLDGKTALITGGNSGIGLETARILAKKGAKVIIASRDEKKALAALAQIATETGNSNLHYKPLDLSKFDSIRKFADDFNKTEPRLDILVNNAGVAGVRNRLTVDGYSIVAQINYLGAFLLTNLLKDKLIASKPSRIVVISSVGNRFCRLDPSDISGVNSLKLSVWESYARSKLLQILWTKALAKRLPLGVTVNAAHPGIVQTDIFNKLSPFYRTVAKTVIDLLFKTPREGAQTIVHLCCAPELEHASGGYYADCKPSANVSARVKDDSLIEHVWHESQKLTNV